MSDELINALVLIANFILVPGLAYGSQLALGALGITLVYAVLRFSNFAHGDTMAFGATFTILATWWLQSKGISLGPLPTALLALPAGIIMAILLCLIFDRLVYRHYRQNKSPPVVFVIASVGVMFVTNGLVRFIIGPNDQQFTDGQRFLIRARDFKNTTGLSEGLSIKLTQGLTVVVALIAMLLLFWFLQRTRMGKAMRAFSDNEDLALLSGIDPQRVVLVTWIIVATLTTIAGVLYGLDKSFKPFTYFQLLLPMFAAAIVGGIGKPLGAILGGFIVAFSEITLTYAYKKFLKYLLPEEYRPDSLVQLLSTDYKFAVSLYDSGACVVMAPDRLASREPDLMPNTMKALLGFAVVAMLLLAVGLMQSWSLALAITNMCLISAVMALGVNIQWGYAGLFNVGVMGFAALGGVAAMLVSTPPVYGAWQIGGTGLAMTLVWLCATIALDNCCAPLVGARCVA